jgi:hypothetical protein
LASQISALRTEIDDLQAQNSTLQVDMKLSFPYPHAAQEERAAKDAQISSMENEVASLQKERLKDGDVCHRSDCLGRNNRD